MIIDIHTHIVHEDVRLNKENYFDSEPAFKLLYESPAARLCTAEEVIEVMNEQNVDKSVVFGFPWKNSDVFRANNDYVIESVKKYPDRLIGFGCFDLESPDAVAEAERCLDGGLAGIGELAFYQSGIDEASVRKMKPVMALCRERDFPVMIHTNEPVGHYYPGKTPVTLAQIYNLARTYPDNKIILCHWGGGVFFFNLLKKEAKDVLKNIWYDTAATPFLYDADVFNAAIALTGVEKILFGTDYPLLKPARYYKELEKAGITEENRDKILGGNAADLLNLKI